MFRHSLPLDMQEYISGTVPMIYISVRGRDTRYRAPPAQIRT